jgi:hypothetical protein
MVMSKEAMYLKSHCNGDKENAEALPPSIAIPGVLLQKKARKIGRPRKDNNENLKKKAAPAKHLKKKAPAAKHHSPTLKTRIHKKSSNEKKSANDKTQEKNVARLQGSDSLFSFSQPE